MSALPPKADVCVEIDVCFVPQADIRARDPKQFLAVAL
jgi:hypothetical protein